MDDILTVCCYCGCGCGLYLHVEDGRVTGTIPSRNHPVTRNNLCVRGWQAHSFIHHADRLTRPLVRRQGVLKPADWEEALQRTADALLRIRKQTGPDSIGIVASAKCTNEENFLLQKFARAVVGTNNIDHCARL